MHRQRGRHGYGRHEMSRGHGRGRHRVRRGDVRTAVLALLDDRPMHGYEMIQLLEDEGLVTPEEVDGRKVYSLTDAGKEAAPERTEGGRPWEQGDEDSPRFEARKEMFKLMGAAKQLARADDEEQPTKAAEILGDARRKLYGLLAEE